MSEERRDESADARADAAAGRADAAAGRADAAGVRADTAAERANAAGARAAAANDTRHQVRRAEAARERFDRELAELVEELRALVARGRDSGEGGARPC